MLDYSSMIGGLTIVTCVCGARQMEHIVPRLSAVFRQLEEMRAAADLLP